MTSKRECRQSPNLRLPQRHPYRLHRRAQANENQVPMAQYCTNRSRVILSRLAGSVTGALLVTLSYLISTAQNLGIQYILDYGLRPSLIVFTVAAVVWAAGLTVFGSPLWWVLHKLRLRHWLVAAVVGASVTLLVDFGLETRGFGLIPLTPSNATYSAGDAGGPTIINNILTAHGWWVAFQGALMLSVGGILVALAVWRVAYRSVDDETTVRA